MNLAPMVMTADELLVLRMPDKRTELVRGRLVVREPARFWHGDVAARVLVAISNYLAAGPDGMRTPFVIDLPRFFHAAFS